MGREKSCLALSVWKERSPVWLCLYGKREDLSGFVCMGRKKSCLALSVWEERSPVWLCMGREKSCLALHCPTWVELSESRALCLCVCLSLSLSLFVSLSLSVCLHRLVGLVERRPPRERKIPGSNPACAGIFSGSSHTIDSKISTPGATLPGAWRYRVSSWTGRPGVSIL